MRVLWGILAVVTFWHAVLCAHVLIQGEDLHWHRIFFLAYDLFWLWVSRGNCPWRKPVDAGYDIY